MKESSSAGQHFLRQAEHPPGLCQSWPAETPAGNGETYPEKTAKAPAGPTFDEDLNGVRRLPVGTGAILGAPSSPISSTPQGFSHINTAATRFAHSALCRDSQDAILLNGDVLFSGDAIIAALRVDLGAVRDFSGSWLSQRELASCL